jgi:hypothetical protein
LRIRVHTVVHIVHKRRVGSNRTDSVYLTKGAGDEGEIKRTIMPRILACVQEI